jgi:hypothetical protein
MGNEPLERGGVLDGMRGAHRPALGMQLEPRGRGTAQLRVGPPAHRASLRQDRRAVDDASVEIRAQRTVMLDARRAIRSADEDELGRPRGSQLGDVSNDHDCGTLQAQQPGESGVWRAQHECGSRRRI